MAIRGFVAQYVNKARKVYTCEVCEHPIKVGQAYEYQKHRIGLDGEMETLRYHYGAFLPGTVKPECPKQAPEAPGQAQGGRHDDGTDREAHAGTVDY